MGIVRRLCFGVRDSGRGSAKSAGSFNRLLHVASRRIGCLKNAQMRRRFQIGNLHARGSAENADAVSDLHQLFYWLYSLGMPLMQVAREPSSSGRLVEETRLRFARKTGVSASQLRTTFYT
jgi:hypothetical protein